MTDLTSIQPRTLRKVVAYLEDKLGLSIYGTHVDMETAKTYPGCMDYTVDDIIKLRQFYMDGKEFVENE